MSKRRYPNNDAYQGVVLNAEVVQQLFGASEESFDFIWLEETRQPQVTGAQMSQLNANQELAAAPVSAELHATKQVSHTGVSTRLARRSHLVYLFPSQILQSVLAHDCGRS